VEQTIGETAGKLWRQLKDKGPQTPTALTKALNMKAADVDRAIGWLAREGKLGFEPDLKGGTKLTLKKV